MGGVIGGKVRARVGYATRSTRAVVAGAIVTAGAVVMGGLIPNRWNGRRLRWTLTGKLVCPGAIVAEDRTKFHP